MPVSAGLMRTPVAVQPKMEMGTKNGFFFLWKRWDEAGSDQRSVPRLIEDSEIWYSVFWIGTCELACWPYISFFLT
jgi:hypothetical protein